MVLSMFNSHDITIFTYYMFPYVSTFFSHVFPTFSLHSQCRATIRAADAADLLADAAGLVVRGLQDGSGFIHGA